MSFDKKQNNYDVPYNNFDKPPVEIVDSSNKKKKKTIILIAVAVGVVILCVLLGTLFAKLGKADADKKTTGTNISDIYDYSSETESIDSSSINFVPTPDCLGKTKEEVVGILDSLGITYDIISFPSSDEEKNKVITQSIEAGEEIPEGAVLTIVIGEGVESTLSATMDSGSNQTKLAIPISSVTINLSKTVLYPGETVKIKRTYSPSNATETEYYYTVDNYSIAYIDENDNLCAINPGTTNIRAMDLEGNSLGRCSITIKAKETTTKKVTTTQKSTTTAKPVCTVTFDANGGSVSTNSRKVNLGESIGTLPVATRTGYTFDGWYTHPSGGSQITEYSSMSSSNQTLYAHWTPITYELRFDANGGAGAPAAQKGSSSYTISSTQPSRSGYTFLGWSKNSSASSASYHAGDSILLSSNTTLYAVWRKNEEVKAFEAWKNDNATPADMEKIVRFVNDELDSRQFMYGRMNNKGLSSQSYYYANDTSTSRQYDSIESLCNEIDSHIRFQQMYNNCGNYNIYYEEYSDGKYCIIVSFNYLKT